MAIHFPETLSTKEAAQILRRHPRTVSRWVRAGKLPGTYDQETGLTLVYADPLLERLRAGEVDQRRSLLPPTPQRAGAVRGVGALTDEEWRARFAV
jgi:hypothetical protein